MNVATVKPSLFLQLKQTECVISWLLLLNPESQEGLSHQLTWFFAVIFQLFQIISMFACTKPLRREQLTLP